MVTPTMDLRIAAAQYVVGNLQSWDLPPIADKVLAAGHYSAALGELATSRDPTMADVGPLFEQALADFNIPRPSRDEAVGILLRYYVQRIASGAVTARQGLKPLMELYDLADLHKQSREFAGDAYGLQHLVGAYWAYDDLDGRSNEVSYWGRYGAEAVEALNEDVVRWATEWCAQYCA